MRIWLSKNSEVPLREQLTAQIMLGIISSELKPGQKLPSIRELARRYRIHSNTVNAAYRDLAERHWVEFRKGSGVFVRKLDEQTQLETKLELDQLISSFLKIAREKGFPVREIQSRMNHWFEIHPPDHFLVIENDPDLRQILMTEIVDALDFPTMGTSFEDCQNFISQAGVAPVTLYSRAELARTRLPASSSCLLLHIRSVPESLQGEKPLPPETLVSVVSHWSDFLRWAHTILVAAGVDPLALSFHDAHSEGWQKALGSSTFTITDSVVVKQISPGFPVKVFRIIADSSMKELRGFLQDFGVL